MGFRVQGLGLYRVLRLGAFRLEAGIRSRIFKYHIGWGLGLQDARKTSSRGALMVRIGFGPIILYL